jgi:hypothetical protein
VSRYSLVYFTPEPPLGTRYLIGAQVETDGALRFVVAKRLPCAVCMGGPRMAAFLDLVVQRLGRMSSFDDLGKCGLSVTGDEVRPFPFPEHDAAEWIERHMLPGGRDDAGEAAK